VLLALLLAVGIPPALDGALLGTGLVLIAADSWQSARNISRGTLVRGRLHHEWDEANPLVAGAFGPNPSALTFAAIGVAGGAGLTAAWLLLPRRWRWVAPAVVCAVEGFTVGRNAAIGMRF